MSYILIGSGALVGLYFGLRWFARANPAQVARSLKVAAILLAVGGVVLLVVVGRIGLVLMLAGLLLPLIVRWRNARRLAGMGGAGPMSGRPGATPGGSSTVDTIFFAMTLDHESGALDGEIRRGRHRGKTLSGLDLPELLALLDECHDDAASAQVLSAYLDRSHPAWRETATGQGSAGIGAAPAITHDEAFRILGLEPGASEADIRAAHHRLMMKFHPDQGGSTWFAARINEARDLLIGG